MVLGAGAVGKTSTIYRFVSGEWHLWWDFGIEDSYTADIQVDGINHQLDILDTVGQEQYGLLQYHWIREGEGFILMYAVNNHKTFVHAQQLYIKILRMKEDERIDLVLIGNKSDLPDTEREVTYEMGKQLADEWNVPFVEQSAKTGENVQETFELLVREVFDPKEHLHPPCDEIDKGGNSCYIM